MQKPIHMMFFLRHVDSGSNKIQEACSLLFHWVFLVPFEWFYLVLSLSSWLLFLLSN